VVRQVLAGSAPAETARRAREEAEDVDDRRQLVLERALVGLAAVRRLEPGERLRLALDAVGELQQHPGPLGGGRPAPGLERALGGGHRPVDLGGRRLRNRGGHRPGGGIEDLLFRALARDEPSVDQELGLHG
jgi:hypothetical protein